MNRTTGHAARGLAAILLSVWLGGAAVAAPVPADLQTRLIALYTQWQTLLIQGKFAEAAAVSVPELSKQIVAATKSKEDAAGLRDMAREMAPDKVEPRHASLSKDGKRVAIVTLASKQIPADAKMPPDGPKPGSVMHAEVTLQFERDGDDWKFAEQRFGADPAERKACHDDATASVAAFDQGRMTSAGGPIDSVEFKADHTLVVFRVVDEENCAVLPPKDQLAKHGVNPAALVPYAIIELDGYPHKTDKQRVWAEKFRVTAED